ncbi:MAG: hypothetical protein ACI39R_03940 [Lachnospiraceae bacterium]
MNNIFDTGDDRKLALFEHGKNIYMSIISGDFSGKPRLLAADFGKALTSCVFQNKLYYAYVDKDGQVKVKSIDDNRTKWNFGNKTQELLLASYKDSLILMFTEETAYTNEPACANEPEYTHEPECSNNTTHTEVTESPGNEVHAVNKPYGKAEKRMILGYHVLVDNMSTSNEVQHKDYSGNLSSDNPVKHSTSADAGILLSRLYETTELPKSFEDIYIRNQIERKVKEASLDIKKDYLFSITAEQEEKFAALREQLKKDFEERCRKLHEDCLAEKQTEAERFHKKIKELNTTIDSIKLQYNQLMKTAASYKADAAKWHALYQGRGKY